MKNLSKSVKNSQEKAIVLGNGKKEATKDLVPAVLIVHSDTKKEEPKETEQPKTEAITQEQPHAEQEQAHQEQVKNETTQEQPKRLTMEELNDKADRLYLQRQKYQTIKEKIKQLESFTISHDNNNAQLTLIDANGLSIKTSNPQSIGKLLTDWMADLVLHLGVIENEMRKQLEA